MANNYDNAAWFYDSLSRVVFGKAIVNAQVYLLEYIPPKSKILIAGGGTGWILDELILFHPAGLEITYVEISAKMMAYAVKRNTGANVVTFINSAVEDVQFHQNFDVVITPFLFDNFTEQTAQKVFNNLNAVLNADGLWLYADFEPRDKLWQKILLKTMLVFFRILCGVEASGLPDVTRMFARNGYNIAHKTNFFKNFIAATVYSRAN